MPRRHSALLVSACLFAACVPPSVRRPVRPPPAAPAVVLGPNIAGPWVLGTTSALQRVTISTRAVVSITDAASAHTDTLQAALAARYVWSSRAHRRLDGTLEDYRVGVGGAPTVVPAGLQLVRAFTAEASAQGGPLSFRVPIESTACTEPTLSALQGLHDAWIPVPDTLAVGREWTDTVQTLSCRDRIPLHGTAVRRFRVVRATTEDSARVVVLIDRISRGRMAGDGEQFGERVSLTGETSGTMRYMVDPATGRLLRAAGTASLALSLKSSRRNQQVKQESAVTISWPP